MWAGIAAARLGGRVTDISHAVESYVRAQPLRRAASTASSRSSPATASAPRCTSRPTCPTTAVPAEAPSSSAASRSPWSRWSRWAASTPSWPRTSGRSHRRRQLGGALRAHLHPDPRRRLDPDRPRRRQRADSWPSSGCRYGGRRGEGAVKPFLLLSIRAEHAAADERVRVVPALHRARRVRAARWSTWSTSGCPTSTSTSGRGSCSAAVRGTPATRARPSRRRRCARRRRSRACSTTWSRGTSRSSAPATGSARSGCTRAVSSTAAGPSRWGRCR